MAIYVHIPFCQYKCTFCDFAAYAGRDDQMEPYLEALLHEICLRTPPGPPRRVPTVFVGGGTPSRIPVAHLERMLDSLRASFDLEPDAEITLESNPGTLDRERMLALRQLGVTRLSVGVQSLNDHVLLSLNRLHTAAQATTTIATAREAGFASVSADLIYGLPGQDKDDWRATLCGLVDSQPDHLSAYGLIVEPGTLLRRQLQEGHRRLPDDDEAADMYEFARAALGAAGYVQYEMSNWARPGHQCRHNLTYWRHLPYLGFGLSAHSYFDHRRFANVRGLQGYIARLGRGEPPTATSEPIGPERARADAAMLGLRLVEGIHVPTFDARFGGSLLGDHAATIERLGSFGLLEVVEDHLRVTPRGYLVANQVWQEFI